MSRSTGEPKNGDFVAYIESLQQEQLDALRAANPRPASLNEMHEAIERKRGSIAGFLKAAVGRSLEQARRSDVEKADGMQPQRDALERTASSNRPRGGDAVGAVIGFALVFGGAAAMFYAMETGNEHLAPFALFALFIGTTLFSQLRKSARKRRNR